MMKDDDFSFEIKEHLGDLFNYSTGWKKEVNLVEWNGGHPKLDIRDWDPNHERMSRGVTLHDGEAKALIKVLEKYFKDSEKQLSD